MCVVQVCFEGSVHRYIHTYAYNTVVTTLLIQTEMHICIDNVTIISSNNGLLPVWHLAIIWTNAGLLSIGHLRKKLQQNFDQNSYIFIKENVFENIIWKMEAILSQLQYVKIGYTLYTNILYASYNITCKINQIVCQGKINDVNQIFTPKRHSMCLLECLLWVFGRK